MIITEESFLKFIPKELVMIKRVLFDFPCLNLKINSEKWPKNLIYNPDLIESYDMFYEEFCSDSTLNFYVHSAIRVCKSLISRAMHQRKYIWEHGPIRVREIDGICSEHWMIRTKTEVALRKINDNQ